MQESGDGSWVHVGVDSSMAATAPALHPGIGLRPGGERPDLEEHVVRLYIELFETVAAHARNGSDVVVDIGLHDSYSRPLGIADELERRLEGLRVLWVGVRCDDEELRRRRVETWGQAPADADAASRRWEAVHDDKAYDLEVDTSQLTPERCAAAIRERLTE